MASEGESREEEDKEGDAGGGFMAIAETIDCGFRLS